MNPTDPWAIPPIPTHGDPDRETVFASVGRALTAWEQIEGHLGLLFAAFVEAGNVLAATRAYGALASFNGRMDLVRRSAEAYFSAHPDDVVKAELRAVMAELQRASPMRNNIAHGFVSEVSADGEPRGFALLPGYYMTSRRSLLGDPAYVMASSDLDRLARQFAGLQKPLAEILDALWASQAQRRK